MIVPSESLLNWIKAHRKRLGWSQEKLAKELGVDVGTVSRWERGVLSVDRRTILAVERLLDVQ